MEKYEEKHDNPQEKQNDIKNDENNNIKKNENNDIKQEVNSDTKKDENNDINKDKSNDINKDEKNDVKKDENKDIKKDEICDIKKDENNDVKKDNNNDIKKDDNNDFKKDDNNDIKKNENNDVKKDENNDTKKDDNNDVKKDENSDDKKDDNNYIKKDENNDVKIDENKEIKKDEKEEPKKGMGRKFLSLIETKFNNISNTVSNYRKERKRLKEEQNLKKKEEKKNEQKEEKKDEPKEEKKEEIKEEKKEEKEKAETNQEKESKEENKEDRNNIIEDNNNKVNEIITQTPLIKNSDETKTISEEIPQSNNSTTNPPETNTSKITPEDKKEEFSKEELNKCCIRFHTILTEYKKYDLYTQEITSILDELAEFLIHGDKNDQELLDSFVYQNYLYDILCMMGKMNKNINIQIIKFFSVLMTNLSEKNFNFFLNNSDYINQIVYESRETIDGDYLYYYINFTKSLLFKINKDNLKYFFHEDNYTFPLLLNCLKFYHHPDSMISNTIRNIFLFVLKMNNKQCIDYICNLPMISYFVFISCRLRDEIKTLNKKITRGKSEASTILHERICNDILYFQDIFSINIEKINFILTNCIFHFLILPTLCNSIIIKPEEVKKNNIFDTSNDVGFFGYTKNILKEMHKENNNLLKDCISKDLALYILNLFFKYIKNETFLNALTSILFLPKIHYKIMEKIKRPIKDLFNYKGDFAPKAKNKIYLEKSIIENYTPPYMRGLLSAQNRIFYDLNKIERKLQEKCKINKAEYNLNMSVAYGYYMEVINDYFSRSGLRECKEYHQTISEATGIQCGLSFHNDRKCILYLLNKNLKYIKNDFSFEKVKTKYFDNIINISFMNEFKECKNLYLLLLYNYLFNQILSNNIISKELLAHVELLNPNEIHKNKKSNIEEEDDPILKVGDLINSSEEEKKSKNKNKIENINFSNLSKVMYCKDFCLNDFHLYSNDILSKYFYNGQTAYNATIFGVILTFLNSGDVLRPEIYLFLIKLIKDLIIYEENNKKHLLNLRDYHVTIIKNIFKKNVEHIIKCMNKAVEISEEDLKKIFECFSEIKNGEDKFAEYDVIIHDFMEDCLFLINKKPDEKDKTYNEKLELYNKLDIESLEIKIRIYFLKIFFDIYNGVFEGKINEIKMEELTEDNKNNLKEIIINNLNKLINDDNINK